MTAFPICGGPLVLYVVGVFTWLAIAVHNAPEAPEGEE